MIKHILDILLQITVTVQSITVAIIPIFLSFQAIPYSYQSGLTNNLQRIENKVCERPKIPLSEHNVSFHCCQSHVTPLF